MKSIHRKIVFVFIMIFICNVVLLNGIQAHAEAAGETSNEDPAFPWEEALGVTAQDWPDGPDIEAETAILVEAETGTILYEKNMHQQMYPASITKVLTTLVALEHLTDYNETITFSHDAVYSIEPGSSHIGINENEELTVEQCLHAVMLASANECSYALGEHAAGEDYGAFIQMMNDRAAELGARNSQFRNAHGLPDEEHYTSAYDMALIAREAFTHEKFRELISTYAYEIPETNLVDEVRRFQNNHKMLPQGMYAYDGCLGGKTGFTNDAGHTLVTFAERDGVTLVAVVMRSAIYEDTKTLLDYGFKTYSTESIRSHNADTSALAALLEDVDITGDESHMYLTMSDDGTVVLPEGVSFADLTPVITTTVTSDEYLGTLMYTYEGKYVGYVSLSGQSDENADGVIAQIYTEPEKEEETAGNSDKGPEQSSDSSSGPGMKLVVTIIILMVLAAAALIVPKRRKDASGSEQNKM